MPQWIFTYDAYTSPDRFRDLVNGEVPSKAAKLQGYKLVFTRNGGCNHISIVESPGSTVLGTAYLVEDGAIEQLVTRFPGYQPVKKVTRFNNGEEEAVVLKLAEAGESRHPTAKELGLLREALTYYHPGHRVDAYLAASAGTDRVFAEPVIQRAEDAVYKLEYNCNFRRLYPWKGVVRASWGGAIGVVAPGMATTPHNHDEEETAFVVSGEGELTVEGETTQIGAGDVIFFPPYQTHTLLNTSVDKNLEILFIWWGGVSEEQREAARMHA